MGQGRGTIVGARCGAGGGSPPCRPFFTGGASWRSSPDYQMAFYEHTRHWKMHVLEAGAAAEARVLPAFLDRPGAELLLAHRAREVRVVEDVAHDLHGQVALRRLAVARAANVVVEAVLRARPRRVRGRMRPRWTFSGVFGSWSRKLEVLTTGRQCSETLEHARCPEFELELCAVRSGCVLHKCCVVRSFKRTHAAATARVPRYSEIPVAPSRVVYDSRLCCSRSNSGLRVGQPIVACPRTDVRRP